MPSRIEVLVKSFIVEAVDRTPEHSSATISVNCDFTIDCVARGARICSLKLTVGRDFRFGSMEIEPIGNVTPFDHSKFGHLLEEAFRAAFQRADGVIIGALAMGISRMPNTELTFRRYFSFEAL